MRAETLRCGPARIAGPLFISFRHPRNLFAISFEESLEKLHRKQKTTPLLTDYSYGGAIRVAILVLEITACTATGTINTGISSAKIEARVRADVEAWRDDRNMR